MDVASSLDLAALRSFLVLCEQQHFGRAAERLGVSQPALTQRLQRLEAQVGGALLLRKRGELRPTEAGGALLERARGLLREADLTLDVARQALRGETGVLRIGFGIASLAQLLPDLLLRFRRVHPHVRIQMSDMASAAQLEALRRDELELGFVRMPVADPEFECALAHSETLVLALGSGVRLGSHEGLEALRAQPFVVCSRATSASYYDHVVALCRRAGFVPNVVQESGELFTLLQLVRAGLGVSLVPSAAAGMRVPGVRFRALAMPEAGWEIGLVYRRRESPSPLIAAFVALSREVQRRRGAR